MPPIICGRFQTHTVALLAAYGTLTKPQITRALGRTTPHDARIFAPLVQRQIVTTARARTWPSNKITFILSLNSAHPSYNETVSLGRALASRLIVAEQPTPLAAPVHFDHSWKHVENARDQFFGDVTKSSCIIIIAGCEAVSMSAVVNVTPTVHAEDFSRTVRRYVASGVLRRTSFGRRQVLTIDPRWFAADALIRLARSLSERAYPEYRGRIAAAIHIDEESGLRDADGNWRRLLARA